MKICIISHVQFYKSKGNYICRPGFAKLMEMVSPLYDTVRLCVPVYTKNAPCGYGQFNISNVKICSLPPYYKKSHLEVAALIHPLAIISALWPHVKRSDVVWIILPNAVSILGWLVCLIQSKQFAMRVGGNWPKVLRLAFQERNVPFLGPIVGSAFHILLKVMIRTSKLTLVHGPELAEIYGKGNSHVVPFASSTVHESEIIRDVAGSAGQEHRVLYVGRLDLKKGLRELLSATQMLLNDGLRIRIRLAGEGRERQKVEEFIKRLGIENQVDFLGWVQMGSALQQEYRSADVFVLPSYSETGPKVVVEAMANGLPVVASNVGSVRWFVQHGKTGFVVPPHDVAAIKDAVHRILTDEFMRRRMAKAGLVRAHQFTIEAERKLIGSAFRRYGFLDFPIINSISK